jgi:Type I phosphodiesterase / nucleotide pyrophosphatase
MLKLVLAVAAAAFASAAAAQAPPPPKLLVVISVDQLSGDLFDAYRPQFTSGLARLSSGALFRNGSATSPGVPALGGLLKANGSGSRSVAISGSQGAMSGQGADQRWYWAGSWFETNLAGAPVPRVVPKVNAAVARALSRPRAALQPTPFCAAKAGRTRLARAAGDAAALAASPELDGDTLALAAGLVSELQLGRGAAPDLLAIDLAATDNVARAYGPSSEEMCLQLTELDREIGDFLALLDSRGVDYAVALDGVSDRRVPILLWRPGFTGAMVSAPADSSDLEATLAVLINLASQRGRCLEGTPAFCPR